MPRNKKKSETRGKRKLRQDRAESKALDDTNSVANGTDHCEETACSCSCTPLETVFYNSWDSPKTITDTDAVILQHRKVFYLTELYGCHISFEEKQVEVLAMARRHAGDDLAAQRFRQVSWIKELRALVPDFVGTCNQPVSEDSYLGLVKAIRHLKHYRDNKLNEEPRFPNSILDEEISTCGDNVLSDLLHANATYLDMIKPPFDYRPKSILGDTRLDGLVRSELAPWYLVIYIEHSRISQAHTAEGKSMVALNSMLNDIATELLDISNSSACHQKLSKQGTEIHLLNAALVMRILDIAADVYRDSLDKKANISRAIAELQKLLFSEIGIQDERAIIYKYLLHLLLAQQELHHHKNSLDPRAARKLSVLRLQEREIVRELRELQHDFISIYRIRLVAEYCATMYMEPCRFEHAMKTFCIHILWRRLPKQDRSIEARKKSTIEELFLRMVEITRDMYVLEDGIEKAEVNRRGESVLNFRGRHLLKSIDFTNIDFQSVTNGKCTQTHPPHEVLPQDDQDSSFEIKKVDIEDVTTFEDILSKARTLVDTIVAITSELSGHISDSENFSEKLDFRPL